TTVIEQAEYADKQFSVGMVPINGARKDTVSWVMCCLPDMMPSAIGTPVVSWARISDLTGWLRDDVGQKGFQPYPRHQRIAQLSHASAQPVWCFPMETFAWSLATARDGVPDVGEDLVLCVSPSVPTAEKVVVVLQSPRVNRCRIPVVFLPLDLKHDGLSCWICLA